MVKIDPRYKDVLPDVPDISEEDIRSCREAKDFSPILFEWYKFICGICAFFANFLQSSEVVRKDIKKRDYGILIGLINRCAR